MSRHEEILHACVCALARSNKAMDRGDYASTLDWAATAFAGLVRLAKDTGHIPENYQPRLRRLPVQSRKRHRAGETP